MAADSAKIGRLTEAAIASTGGAAKLSADQVSDLVTAISNKTGVDDEAIQSGANLLLTFTGIRNEAGKGNDIFTQRSIAFTIGYSPTQRRFLALSYSSSQDFEPTAERGLWAMPSSLDSRPTDHELDRLAQTFSELFGDTDDAPVRNLRSLPLPQPPRSARQWLELAKAARKKRGLMPVDSGLKAYIGGDVIHTRLEIGAATQRRVHTFDDQGAEFEAMMAGSLHPAGQLGACNICDSGRPLVECCLRELDDKPCPRGSGDNFTGCCRVAAPADEALVR